MIEGAILEGLTFDDVLLLPGKSSILPTRGRHADLPDAKNRSEYPVVSAAMDTVTGSRLRSPSLARAVSASSIATCRSTARRKRSTV